MEGRMFKVEHLDPVLRKRDGRFGFYGYKIAQRLEKLKKGKICVEGHIGPGPETKVLLAGGSGEYLTKTAFVSKRSDGARNSLGSRDLYGDKEEAKREAEEKAKGEKPDGLG